MIIKVGHLDIKRRRRLLQVGLGLWQTRRESGFDIGNLDFGQCVDVGLDTAGDLDLGSFGDRGLILGLGRRGRRRVEGDRGRGDSPGPRAGGLSGLVFLQTFDEGRLLAGPYESL
jgi:hypothetical protein